MNYLSNKGKATMLSRPRVVKSSATGKLTKNYPTEEQEQKAFVDWLNAKHIPHHHSPNEGGFGNQQSRYRGAKMKRLGASKGFWDLVIFIPIEGITGSVDAYQQVMVEMKRQKGGTVSPEQKEWGKIYEKAGIPCKVCHGAEEAIKQVQKWTKEIK